MAGGAYCELKKAGQGSMPDRPTRCCFAALSPRFLDETPCTRAISGYETCTSVFTIQQPVTTIKAMNEKARALTNMR